MASDIDGLLVFSAHSNVPGLCHLRCYHAGLIMCAIVGELGTIPALRRRW